MLAGQAQGQHQLKGRAETKPFVMGQVDQIPSAVLGEARILNIYLPEGYDQDVAARYPVIYLLDGSATEDFVHISGIVQFLTMIGRMPKTIIVGIANVDRKRDFTFPTTVEKDRKDFPTTGGSEKFMSFLEKELLPFIDRKYRTSPDRTIIGQSLGGLFATEILLKKPGLFTDYIIVSPSLWWNKESLLLLAPKAVAGYEGKAVRVCISVGKEGEQMEVDAKRLSDILRVGNKKCLTSWFVYMPDENHLTILHNCVYRSLEILYPLTPDGRK